MLMCLYNNGIKYKWFINDLIEIKRNKKEYFNEYEIILYINCIANGLKIIHENGIFHRDIKPDNILLNNNNKYEIKISDFGISSLQNIDSLTTAKGTFAYMAPEQMGKYYDKSVDIWSFGITIYEIITLQKPPTTIFSSLINQALKEMKNNMILLKNYNKKLIEIILKMLSPNPKQRPNAQQIIDDIQVNVIFFSFLSI